MYLGVHTLLDVAAGAITGLIWVYIANFVFDLTDNKGRQLLLLLFLIPMAAAMIFIRDKTFYKIAGTFFSFLIGYLIDLYYIKYDTSGSLLQKVLRYIIGLAVLFAIKTLVKKLIGESLAATLCVIFSWVHGLQLQLPCFSRDFK